MYCQFSLCLRTCSLTAALSKFLMAFVSLEVCPLYSYARIYIYTHTRIYTCLNIWLYLWMHTGVYRNIYRHLELEEPAAELANTYLQTLCANPYNSSQNQSWQLLPQTGGMQEHGRASWKYLGSEQWGEILFQCAWQKGAWGACPGRTKVQQSLHWDTGS